MPSGDDLLLAGAALGGAYLLSRGGGGDVINVPSQPGSGGGVPDIINLPSPSGDSPLGGGLNLTMPSINIPRGPSGGGSSGAQTAAILAWLENQRDKATDVTTGGGSGGVNDPRQWLKENGLWPPNGNGGGGGGGGGGGSGAPDVTNPLTFMFESGKGTGEFLTGLGSGAVDVSDYFIGENPGKAGSGKAGLLETGAAGWKMLLTGRATDPRTGSTKSFDPLHIGPNAGPLYQGPDPLGVGSNKADVATVAARETGKFLGDVGKMVGKNPTVKALSGLLGGGS